MKASAEGRRAPRRRRASEARSAPIAASSGRVPEPNAAVRAVGSQDTEIVVRRGPAIVTVAVGNVAGEVAVVAAEHAEPDRRVRRRRGRRRRLPARNPARARVRVGRLVSVAIGREQHVAIPIAVSDMVAAARPVGGDASAHAVQTARARVRRGKRRWRRRRGRRWWGRGRHRHSGRRRRRRGRGRRRVAERGCNPVAVGRDTRVDARRVRLAAAVAPAHDARLRCTMESGSERAC